MNIPITLLKFVALSFACILFNLNILHAQAQQPATISVVFEHMVNDETLTLGNSYKNFFGEQFTPKNFQYYISNICLMDDSSCFESSAEKCFLIDEDDAESKNIEVSVPYRSFKKLRFVIGIDSLLTVSGVHEGALDPYHGMFWTWNTGFVSAKLEGFSPASTMPQQMFQYHIGGFRTGQNTLRTIEIHFPNPVVIQTGGNTTITLTADILKWFKGTHDLKIANKPFVHSPGKIAVEYADNYSSMFQLKSIVQH